MAVQHFSISTLFPRSSPKNCQGQMDCLNGNGCSTLFDFKYPLLAQHLLSNFGTPTHSEFGNPIQEDIPDIRTSRQNSHSEFMGQQAVPCYGPQLAAQQWCLARHTRFRWACLWAEHEPQRSHQNKWTGAGPLSWDGATTLEEVNIVTLNSLSSCHGAWRQAITHLNEARTSQ